eukprot:1769233-Amphidinium_carterae.1
MEVDEDTMGKMSTGAPAPAPKRHIAQLSVVWQHTAIIARTGTKPNEGRDAVMCLCVELR